MTGRLWNQLPSSFRQPHSVHSPPGSPHTAHITSSQSSPSFSPSVTPSAFYSRLKTICLSFFCSFSGSIWTAFTDLEPPLATGILIVFVSSFFIDFLFCFWLRLLH